MKNLIKNVCLLVLILFTSLHSYAEVRPGSVMYGVVPCLFGERCFEGVTRKLDDIKNQGVDILWISPVFESDDESIISYATTNYFGLRPDFGSDAEFKRLIAGAHARGMKVIMDIVPNHSSNAHPWFLDEKFYNYYDRDAEGEATYYFDWENLPNLNYRNPKVRQMMTDVFLYWIQKYDIDGFRVDAAWGVKQRAPDFWRPFIRKLRAKKRDLIMLAEASVQDPYYIENGFDLAYDWTEKLGIWGWDEVFKNYRTAPQKLSAALRSSNSRHVARFINNNDTGKRFISRHGIKMTKLAAVLQHTAPGIPIVYNGDETGAEFDPYEDPAPLSWRDRHNLKGFYRKLAAFKENTPALHSGSWKELRVVGRNPGIYAFARIHRNDSVVVVLNFSKTQAKVKLELPASIKLDGAKNMLTGSSSHVGKSSGNTYEISIGGNEPLMLRENF